MIRVTGAATAPETALKFIDCVCFSVIAIHGVAGVWYAIFLIIPCVLNAR